MNKKQIEGQLKLSKKQNEDERSDYLCSQFNCVDYLIKLEKYTNNLLRKNKKQKKVIDELKGYLKLNIELIKEQPSNDELTDNFILSRFKSLLDILKEVSE